MMMQCSPVSDSDWAEVEWTERDLAQRLDMISDDADLVVVAGLVAANLVDPSVLVGLLDRDRWDRPLDLERHGVPADHFARFQRLWYHFRVPYATASLVWWYTFCLAMGRDDDVGRATGWMADRVGVLTGAPEVVLPRATGVLGLPAGPVVVAADETGDLSALLLAARLRAPLLAVSDVPAAVEVGRAGGFEVLTVATSAPTPPARSWLGRPVDLAALPDQARRSWQQLPDEERSSLLSQLEQRITSVERVRFLLDEQAVDNREVAKLLVACQGEQVADWPVARLAMVTLLWCWQRTGFVLQELNQTIVSFPSIAAFFTRRMRDYRDRLGETTPLPPATDGVLALAEELAGYRRRIEQSYERCLHFDGSNWERREFLLPLSVYRRVQDVPDGLREHLTGVFGVEVPGYRNGDYLSAWDRFVELVLSAGYSPTRILQEIAHWTANAPDLRVDMAVYTTPIGTKLTEPWAMEYTDLFSYTGFRDGLDVKASGVPMDRVGVQNIMGQRMRFNAVKKAQNYAPVRRFAPQGFNLPDISIAEDAYHRGHAAAGVRLACRVPITTRYRDLEWNGLADVRLNRAEYRRENRFRPHELAVAYRCAQWTKGVADATYRRELQFDRKWGARVTDLDL